MEKRLENHSNHLLKYQQSAQTRQKPTAKAQINLNSSTKSARQPKHKQRQGPQAEAPGAQLHPREQDERTQLRELS